MAYRSRAQLWVSLYLLYLLLPAALFSEPPSLRICEIQGSGYVSPWFEETVKVVGVVTADFDETSHKGFFIQQSNCDQNSATSDGLFIQLEARENVVELAQRIQVTGRVDEFYGRTQLIEVGDSILVLKEQAALPASTQPEAPLSAAAARQYLESLESMRVHLPNANEVGPTNGRLETYVIAANSGLTHVYRSDPFRHRILRISAQGHFDILPQVKVGDRVTGIVGVMDFSIGEYKIHLIDQPLVIPDVLNENLAIEMVVPMSIASLNLHNLFDSLDDPLTADPIRAAADYRRDLEKHARLIRGGLDEPLLLAVQEAENGEVLQALANRPELESHYEFLHADGPDFRGIDVALMYQSERVQILAWEYAQGCTTLVDGLGPDGNLDVEAPENTLTCRTKSNGSVDGNRLFSRPPLQVHLEICDPYCGPYSGRKLWLIINHWKSKSNDGSQIEFTLPRRTAQAEFVAGLVRDIYEAESDPEIIVIGDLNDFPDSQPLAILARSGLVNISALSIRYTYNYGGVSQSLDHILVSPNLLVLDREAIVPMVLHANADYPVTWESDESKMMRASDHDPLVLGIYPTPFQVFLPIMRGSKP